jgi:hypothetical protein
MSRLLPLLVLAAPISLAAQEVVTLDQSLQFSYNGSRVSMAELTSANAYTRANYRFDLGMPILAYRLGAMDLGGSIGYVKQANDSGSDASIGLNTIGVQGSLFPFQPYHVTFDYSRATAPNLFGEGTEVGQSFGLGLVYRGWRVQDLHVTYRHGSTTGIGSGGNFDSFAVTDTERRGRTSVHISADEQIASYGSSTPWRSTGLSITSRTELDRSWSLNSNTFASGYNGSSAVQAGLNLVGNLGAWTSMSSVDGTYTDFEAQSQRTGAFSQSLAHTWDRFSGFSSLGISRGSTSGAAGASSALTSLIFGGSYRLADQWMVMGDLSSTWNATHVSQGPNDTSVVPAYAGRTASYHVGLSWGGELPDVLKHAMFYWSDLRFQTRLQDEYPPDYLPPELAQTVLKRKLDRQGELQFTSDLYHLQNVGDGHQDWLRVQGGLSFATGLLVQTIGDWRRDDRFSDPTSSSESKVLSMYGAYAMGRTSLRFGMGYSKSEITGWDRPIDLPPSNGLGAISTPGASTYYSLGVDTRLGQTPCGAMLYRNNDPTGMGTTTLMTHLSTGFRKVRFNITYQRGWRSDGLRTSQVSINLVRWFDTMALWGLGD